jgi:uncharacterized membrane protein YeaQ/YmgE (transglycosylase-associated protein family)
MKLQDVRSLVLASVLAAVMLLCMPAKAQDAERPVGERIGTATDQAKASLQDTGTVAADRISEVWQRIDERRLKNRTRDEIVAWVLMGLLVGAMAGLFSFARTGATQRIKAVVFGLIGSLLGGMAAHVFQLDFGMGPILIRYEDLLLSISGGLLLILAFRFFTARFTRRIQPETKE